MEKVLVLDANERAALAVTRSLGIKGAPVVTADSMKKTLAGSSRFSSETFSYPSPYVDEEGFVETLKREIAGRTIAVLFPVSEVTIRILLRRRDEFKNVLMPFASLEAFKVINNKMELMNVAEKLGVPTPANYSVTGPADLRTIKKELKYPVILKPACSRVLLDGEWVRASVKYASSEEDLENIIAETPYFQRAPFLIQEYVSGKGRGIFTLYEDGRPIVFFAHRRLRENPPSGGVSVLSESEPVDPELENYARRLLGHVRWHGVAMVGFKVAADGRPYLMEINGRFWGSLQLAVDAGVDFPWLLYRMATGKTLDVPLSYDVGVKNRWLLGDLDHPYYRLLKKIYRVGSLGEGLSTIKNFCRFFDEKTRNEVRRRDDKGPFRFELRQYCSEIKSVRFTVCPRTGDMCMVGA